MDIYKRHLPEEKLTIGERVNKGLDWLIGDEGHLDEVVLFGPVVMLAGAAYVGQWIANWPEIVKNSHQLVHDVGRVIEYLAK